VPDEVRQDATQNDFGLIGRNRLEGDLPLLGVPEMQNRVEKTITILFCDPTLLNEVFLHANMRILFG
jgi:hypothetical protein